MITNFESIIEGIIQKRGVYLTGSIDNAIRSAQKGLEKGDIKDKDQAIAKIREIKDIRLKLSEDDWREIKSKVTIS